MCFKIDIRGVCVGNWAAQKEGGSRRGAESERGNMKTEESAVRTTVADVAKGKILLVIGDAAAGITVAG